MAGLIIYKDYGQFSPLKIVDDNLYKKTIAELRTQSTIKLYFEKGGINMEQLDKARNVISDIVRKLNEGQKVDIGEELSDYFN